MLLPRPAEEGIALAIADRFERSQGREPRDVSYGHQPTCDRVSTAMDGSCRYIEVKGKRARHTSVPLLDRQLRGALAYPDDWWLYVVFDCLTNPALYIVNHVAELDWVLLTPAAPLPEGKKARSVGETAVWHIMPHQIVAAGEWVM